MFDCVNIESFDRYLIHDILKTNSVRHCAIAFMVNIYA